MIVEIAEFSIRAGSESAFETGVGQAAPLFADAKGCRSMKLQRIIEEPQHYLLIVEWETLEDHMEGFRTSPAFQKWRELVGPHFAEAPHVRHARLVLENF